MTAQSSIGRNTVEGMETGQLWANPMSVVGDKQHGSDQPIFLNDSTLWDGRIKVESRLFKVVATLTTRC